MTGIIAAMSVELELIRRQLTDVTEEVYCGVRYYKGSYKGGEVVCAVCGVGKVFAAICATAMILKYSPKVIINTGVAGGLSDDLRILDCTVADKCVQYDMDTTPLGDPIGMISGINRVYFETDKKYSDLLCDSYSQLGMTAHRCTIASGDAFVADPLKKKYIKDTFGASVCDMESASVAHVCFVSGVPFVISRAISDGADDNAEYDFPSMCAKAADMSSRAVLAFIEKTGGK